MPWRRGATDASAVTGDDIVYGYKYGSEFFTFSGENSKPVYRVYRVSLLFLSDFFTLYLRVSLILEITQDYTNITKDFT